MIHVYASIDLEHPAEQVWRLIGGFDSLPKWLPMITASEAGEGGRVRTLTLEDGGVIVERLQVFNEQERNYRYTIERAPLPVRGYLATLQVTAWEKGSRVEWSSTFEADGVPEAEAKSILEATYAGGLNALKERLGDVHGA
ncbi:SRPBCC family protein [Pseudomonas matsuisoli]|uniref:MxaD family protein n=1 Tax=Pseudomonas matsuisoli TaxID=1515666 RepID=A0A917UV72_9PSED|nr:SRPBCC family protein [Pseudomonas matsuisoli]GGJ87647.1 MxaD family protein [Pseudomonas matsuisoli]